MVALLDVNVLIALFDPSHVHHEAAHRWFGKNRRSGWATCPLTENAFARVLSNPAYPGSRTTVQDAAARLGTFCSDRQHVFWNDSVSIRKRAGSYGLTSWGIASSPMFTCLRSRWRSKRGSRRLIPQFLFALSIVRNRRISN